jgi:Tfp pilus assembly protein PilN
VSAKLNLASKPFRNRTLPWLITAIIMSASLLALVIIIGQSRQARTEAAAVTTDLDALHKEEAELKARKEEINRALAPEQRQLLDAAHALVDRKRFSWSRLFADLEASLPDNVRVTRISVKDVYWNGGQNSALLEMAVMSKASGDEVTNMIAEMSRGGVFEAEPMAQNLQKGSSAGGMEWVLRVVYRPRAGAPSNAEQPASVATAAATTSNGGER